MSTQSGGNAAPGWYPTPDGQRYWDGQQWTDQTAPAAPASKRGGITIAGRHVPLWALIAAGVVLLIIIGGIGSASGGHTADKATPASPSSSSSDPAATDVTVPDVSGQAGNVARDTLTAAGLKVDWSETVIVASNWTVTGQQPAAGEKIASGGTVTLTVEKADGSGSAATTPGDLAARLDTELKSAWQVTEYSDGLAGQNGHDPSLLNWYISGITDNGQGVATVTVQATRADTTKDEVRLLSSRIVTLTQGVTPDLQWVVVQTADGAYVEQTHRTA